MENGSRLEPGRFSFLVIAPQIRVGTFRR